MNSKIRWSVRVAERSLVTLALSICCIATQAAIIVQYDANADASAPNPTSVLGGSWSAGGLNPTGVTESAGQEFGENFWEINDHNNNGATNSSRTYFRDIAASSFSDPAGWTATTVVKVLSASNTPSGVTFDVRGGGKLFNLSFVSTNTSELVGRSLQGNTAIIAIQSLELDTYNSFQLWFDPADQLADLYINGNFVSTISPGTSGQNRVTWSSNTSSALGLARWREVRFETGFAVVPEPNSALLCCLAGIACCVGRNRRGRFGIGPQRG